MLQNDNDAVGILFHDAEKQPCCFVIGGISNARFRYLKKYRSFDGTGKLPECMNKRQKYGGLQSQKKRFTVDHRYTKIVECETASKMKFES